MASRIDTETKKSSKCIPVSKRLKNRQLLHKSCHILVHTTNLCCNVEVVNEKTNVYFLDPSPEVLVCLIVEDDGGIGLAPVLPYPSIF